MQRKKNKINSIYINIIVIFLFEIIFNLSTYNYTSIGSIIFYLISSTIFGTIIKLLSCFFHRKINFIINLILLIIINILFIGQFIHYKFYNCLFSIYSMFHSGQIFSWFDYILKVLENNWYILLLFIIPIILVIIFKNKIDFSKETKLSKLLFLLILFGSIILFHICLTFDKKEELGRYNLVYNINNSVLSANKLGVLQTMTLDLKILLIGFNDNVLFIDKENTSSVIKEQTNSYNILNINFKKTNNNKIKKINNYINNEVPTNKNEYTGIFKNKNLIFITAESFSSVAINKDLTPTLYKLANNGFKFNNFYTPIFYVSTSDGEYINQTSLLPKEGTWSLYDSINKYFPYSLANSFSNDNYKTYAYHNGNYKFYNRYLTHLNLGYNKFTACGNGLEEKINCNIWPESDLEMFNNTFNDYKETDNFLVYYMTISGHLSYNFTTNEIAIKNKNIVKNLKLNTEEKAYLAANIELDKALENLINNLKENNLLDDTVIVLSADHYPYGLSETNLQNLGQVINNEKIDKEKNSLIIWNNSIRNPINVDKYSSNLDILPTILNLFGVNYDSRLLMGKDILSNSDGLVIFSNHSWLNEYGYYDSIDNKFISTNNIKLTNEDIKNINNNVYNKFAISRLIYDTNYYKYIK